jgi:hypothetical protein
MDKESQINIRICSAILVVFEVCYVGVLVYISIKFLRTELYHLKTTSFSWIAVGHIALVFIIFGLIIISFLYAGVGLLSLKRKARKVALWVTAISFFSFVSTNYEWRANVTRFLLLSATLLVYYCLLKKPIREHFINAESRTKLR